MTVPDPAPIFGQHGEPCGGCHAALAADQRYCLACGERRASARLPFVDLLRGEGGPPVADMRFVGGAGAAPVPLAERAQANGALIGAVGVLLLAMLIGVLVGLGSGDSGTPAAAATPPQVITVALPAGVAAPAAAPTTTVPTATPSTATTTTPAAPAAPPSKEVDALSGKTGKEYQRQLDKLPKSFSTGGSAPPKDDKAPAGGGEFEEIG